jgi:hypothetical protein
MGQDPSVDALPLDSSLTSDISAIDTFSPTLGTPSLPSSYLSFIPPATGPYSTVGSSTPSDNTLSGIFASLAQGAQSGIKLFQLAQGPGLIAGTNAIYNPSTGQFYNPQTGQVVNPAGSGVGPSIFPAGGIDPSLLLIGGLLIGGALLVSMMGHR